jgi:hypothetical protein
MTRNQAKHKSNHHLRTAAFAAGMLATLGGGLAFGTLVTQADGPDDELATTFTPIEPCRLLDTRPGVDNVGPRATPLGPDETYTIGVTGTVGECNLPDGHAGLALNATAVNASAPTFLTFFPGGTELPLASNLNVVPNQPPTPNKVDIGVFPNREVSIFNRFGSVDVVVDVTGYYSQGKLENLQMQLNALSAQQPFAMTAHSDGQAIAAADGAQTITMIDVLAPGPGALVAHSLATVGTLTPGAEAHCSISTTDTVEHEHRQVWEGAGAGALNGSLAGHRTIQVDGGHTIVRLVCEHAGAGTSFGVDEANLSVLFVPGFEPLPLAESAG